MKKTLLLLFVLSQGMGYSQRYYPKLNNIFLTADDRESVFSNDISFFNLWLKEATNKLFMSNLQTSSNRNSAFYSLEIIPKGNYKTDILNTGILFLLNDNEIDLAKPIPLTFNEFKEVEETTRKGNGYLQILNDKIAIEFPVSLLAPVGDSKNPLSKDAKSKFIISQIDYTIDNNIIEIKLTGKINSPSKIRKDKVVAEKINTVNFKISKDNIEVQVFYLKNKIEKSSTIVNMKVKN